MPIRKYFNLFDVTLVNIQLNKEKEICLYHFLKANTLEDPDSWLNGHVAKSLVTLIFKGSHFEAKRHELQGVWEPFRATLQEKENTRRYLKSIFVHK